LITAVGATVLWPIFGANNQTLAALALFTGSVYLKGRGGKKYLVTFIPALFMIVMTIWALIENEISYIGKGSILLAIVNLIIVVIAVYVSIFSLIAMAKKKKVI